MVSVTGMTVQRIEAELDEMVTSVSVVNGQIIYTRRSGEEVSGGELLDSDLAVAKSYPVNSLFMSTVPTNPADLLGFPSTWIRFGKGRTLVSLDETQPEFDTVGEEGGVKSTTLAIANLPQHSHSINHDHASPSTSLSGGHDHDIAVKYRDDLSNEPGSKEAITGVGPTAQHGDADGSDTGGTSAVGNHFHTVDIPPFTGSSGLTGSLTPTPVTTLQPYIVVYIWKRTA